MGYRDTVSDKTYHQGTISTPFKKKKIPHPVSAVGVSQLQNNDNPSRWAALWVHSPKISLHTLQWAGSTGMNSFHQDRSAEPCLISLCHYKACTVVNTSLINFALGTKGQSGLVTLAHHCIWHTSQCTAGRGKEPCHPFSSITSGWPAVQINDVPDFQWCHGFRAHIFLCRKKIKV